MGMEPTDTSLTRGYETDTPVKRLIGKPIGLPQREFSMSKTSISVDVLISAIDGSTSSNPSTGDIIMILSGDDSVLYPISLLMNLNYTVFLVVPNESNDIHPSQASRIFNWHKDVLGFKFKDTNLNVENLRRAHAIQGIATSPLGSAATAAPSLHSSLSRAVQPNGVYSATPRSNGKSLPTSEPSGSYAPSVADLGTEGFNSYASAAAHGKRAPVKLITNNWNFPSQLLSQVSPPLEDTGCGSPSWDVGGNVTAWASEPVKKSKKAQAKTSKFYAEMTANDSDMGHQAEPGPSGEEQSGVSKEVPESAFEPLLQVLREAKKRSMGRSYLGQELGKNKSIYKTAGVKGFSEYIALAAEKNLVIAGGTEKDQYVRLHPRLKNKQ
jgi:hypothetical protein